MKPHRLNCYRCGRTVATTRQGWGFAVWAPGLPDASAGKHDPSGRCPVQWDRLPVPPGELIQPIPTELLEEDAMNAYMGDGGKEAKLLHKALLDAQAPRRWKVRPPKA